MFVLVPLRDSYRRKHWVTTTTTILVHAHHHRLVPPSLHLLEIVSATSSQEYGTLSSFVPTSATSLRRGNSKGIDDITSHENDACLVNLNTSCVELPVDLSTPPILENRVTVMNLSCNKTTEIPKILSAPIELTVDAKELMFNHFDMTSNHGDDSVSNDLLHVCLFKHILACKFDASKVYSPIWVGLMMNIVSLLI